MRNSNNIIQTSDRSEQYTTPTTGYSDEGPCDTHHREFAADGDRKYKVQDHQSSFVDKTTSTFGGDGPPYLALASTRDKEPPDKDIDGPTCIALPPPNDKEPPDKDVNNSKLQTSPRVPSPDIIVATPKRKAPDKDDHTFPFNCTGNNMAYHIIAPDNDNTPNHVRPTDDDTINNEMSCHADNFNHAVIMMVILVELVLFMLFHMNSLKRFDQMGSDKDSIVLSRGKYFVWSHFSRAESIHDSRFPNWLDRQTLDMSNTSFGELQ